MNFLRILHNEAHQAFTYFCRNSVAWYDANSKSYDLALSLVGANGHEVQTGDFRQRDVEMDGCSVSALRLFLLKAVVAAVSLAPSKKN